LAHDRVGSATGHAEVTDDGTAATAPQIINGLTVRPRKPLNLWLCGLLLLPDFAALLVLVGLGMHRLLGHPDITGRNESQT
jgi:hypothetical protein